MHSSCVKYTLRAVHSAFTLDVLFSSVDLHRIEECDIRFRFLCPEVEILRSEIAAVLL